MINAGTMLIIVAVLLGLLILCTVLSYKCGYSEGYLQGVRDEMGGTRRKQ